MGNIEKSPWLSRHPEIPGLLYLFIIITQLLSLVTFQACNFSSNFLGFFGHCCAICWYFVFGLSSFPFLVGLGWLAICQIFKIPVQNQRLKIVALSVCACSLSFLVTLVSVSWPLIESFAAHLLGFTALGGKATTLPTFRLGGTPFYVLFCGLSQFSFQHLLNYTGTAFISLISFFFGLAYFLELPWQEWLLRLKEKIFNKSSTRKEAPVETIRPSLLIPPKKQKPLLEVHSEESRSQISKQKVDLFCNIEAEHPLTNEIIPYPRRQIKIPEAKAAVPSDPAVRAFSIPPIDLLNTIKKQDQSIQVAELKQKAELLEETLMSFGIEAKVGQVHCGPIIASFEVHPAVGVKIGKIKTLENDIALNLEAKSLRIIAPIPGKPAVGIEIPHNHPQEVSFKEVLAAYKNQGSPFRIPMLLGKGVNGDLVMSDLAKMPHCIIAGATGSGKSVCINSIIMSIVMTSKPEQVRLLMVDPKKVELTPYSELPHMLAPVITEPNSACAALQWLVREMEKRYEMLKLTGQRNIDAFNQRQINEEMEKSFHIPIPASLPYYVAIIDELADLMMVASQDIETPIARIAQMARAVGIHLILATQRPSREVITGLIRANFPARIAFKVASRINSQIILDETGAESLLGNGDMLFLLPGTSQLLRAQGVFIRDEEINKVIDHLVRQAPPQYLISSFDQMTHSLLERDDEGDAGDTLFGDAKNIVISTGNASTTFLQRKLKIGYARAASLMDMLEQRGIVGAPDGSKARKVLAGKKGGNSDKEKEEMEDFDDLD